MTTIKMPLNDTQEIHTKICFFSNKKNYSFKAANEPINLVGEQTQIKFLDSKKTERKRRPNNSFSFKKFKIVFFYNKNKLKITD